MPANDFMTVGVFSSRPEAEVSRARLEAEGLEARVLADDAGGYEPQLGLTNGVRVMVRAPFVALALGILEPLDRSAPQAWAPWVTIVSALLAAVLVLLMSLPVLVPLWHTLS